MTDWKLYLELIVVPWKIISRRQENRLLFFNFQNLLNFFENFVEITFLLIHSIVNHASYSIKSPSLIYFCTGLEIGKFTNYVCNGLTQGVFWLATCRRKSSCRCQHRCRFNLCRQNLANPAPVRTCGIHLGPHNWKIWSHQGFWG